MGVRDFAGDALSIGWVPCGTVGAYVNALSACIQVLEVSAGFEVDALSLVKSVVFVDAKSAKSQFVDFQAIVGDSNAFSVDTPLACTALCVFDAVTCVIQVKVGDAFVTVSGFEVESFAVDFRSDAWTKA